MKKYTVKTAMRWIVERESWTVFERDTVLNGMLADLAFEEAKERQRIRLALSSGAGRQFYSFLRQGEGHPDAHDLLMLRTSLADVGFGEDFVSYVLDAFLYAVSLPDTAPPKEASESPAMGVDELQRLILGYYELSDWDRVVSLSRAAIDVHPDNPEFYNLLGIACEKKSWWSECLQAYDMALTLRPNDAIYASNKAFALALCGKSDLSIPIFERSLRTLWSERASSYVNVLGNFSHALALNGQRDNAARTFHEAVHLGYKWTEVLRQQLEALGVDLSL